MEAGIYISFHPMFLLRKNFHTRTKKRARPCSWISMHARLDSTKIPRNQKAKLQKMSTTFQWWAPLILKLPSDHPSLFPKKKRKISRLNKVSFVETPKETVRVTICKPSLPPLLPLSFVLDYLQNAMSSSAWLNDTGWLFPAPSGTTKILLFLLEERKDEER